MAEEAEKYDMNNVLLENTFNVKEEVEDDKFLDDKIFVCEANVNIKNSELEDYTNNIIATVANIKTELPVDECNSENIKVEDGASSIHAIKIELDNGLLLCEQCHEEYQDYCKKCCGTLVHILNGRVLSNTDNKTVKEIPKDILEFRDSFGRMGIFALKVIPEAVRFGPFTGLDAMECSWKIKKGRFLVNDDRLKFLNWMWYVNPARNVCEQNLLAFQCEGNLYYRSTRQIQEEEELLVYFGEEYEDNLNKDIEVDFIPSREDGTEDVFACTFCCLGFSTEMYLVEHKRNACPKDSNGVSSSGELKQCLFCNIYFYEKEYLESHMPYCCERIVRKCILMALDSQTVKVSRRKTKQSHMYKCTQCKYKTLYKSVLWNHLNKHYEVKMHRCEICSKHFKTKVSLKQHVKYRHIDFEAKADQKLPMKAIIKARSSKINRYSEDKTKRSSKCKFQTKYKYNLETHIKTKHFRQSRYNCEICDFKTNNKRSLKTHVKTKHLKQFSYECEICDYKTNHKQHLEPHVKTQHLKQYSYECEKCDYKTNRKSYLETHVKTKHLKQFSYEYEICDYKTNSCNEPAEVL